MYGASETDIYWQKQDSTNPLFPDVEWNKPERLDHAGKLGIIGGNSLSFAAIADSYMVSKAAGAGEVRALLPDPLRKTIPSSMIDVVFGKSTPSGGLAADSINDVKLLQEWADVLLLAGDAGKNSQTAIIYEDLVVHSSKPIVLTRDAVDLVQNSSQAILDNPHVTYVLSFAQLQRLFRAVYYPKMLVFSMQLTQLIETLHKFTVTYPVTIMTFHADQIIIAHDGSIITQSWNEPMRIWRGHTAARAASYLLWTPQSPLKALAASIC